MIFWRISYLHLRFSIPPFRYEKSTSVGAEVPNSFNIVDVTCQHKGTNFSLNRKYFFKKHSVHKDNIITGMDETSCIHLFSVRLTSKVFGIQTNVVSSPFFAVNQSGYGVQLHNGPRLRKRECKLNFSDLRAYPLIILAIVFN